jgi:RNA-binding protein
MSELSPRQRQQLKGLAHGLKISVQIGNSGLTSGVIESTDKALTAHELIKIKVGQNSEVERKDGANQLAAATQSQVAGVIGRVWILYRPDPEEPRITLV